MAWLYIPSQVSPSAPASAASSSGSVSLSEIATEPSVTWRGKHMPLDDWPRSRFKATWMKHLSGMICEPLTACRSVIEFISSLPVFPANHSPRQGHGRARRIPVGSGPASSKSFATFDRPTSSWRTAPRSGNRPSPSFCGTFPAQGSMRNGTCFRRSKRAIPTSANASSCLLPTPTGLGNNNRAELSEKAGDGLATALRKMLPTPLARDARRFAGAACLRREGTQPLAVIVGRLLPTPTSSMLTTADMEQARYAGNDPARPTYREARDRNALSGALNPRFVEWMMGFPPGWTQVD